MFANPIFLYATLAGAIPILVHLIFRRRRTALDLPTLMFLQRVQMKLASRKRLKEVLLLALRALALIFLALALARPGFHSAGGATGSAAADCVLILDNSASMGLKSAGGTRLEAARLHASAVLASLGNFGRAAILTTVPSDATAQVSTFGGDKEKLSKALQAIQPTDGTGTLIGTLARAGELLESSSAPNREIFLISDFQKNAFNDEPGLKSATASLPPRTSAFLCPVPGGAPENNLSLIGVATDPRPKVAGRHISVVARIKNNSRRELSTAVNLILNTLPQAQAHVTVQPGAIQDVPLPLTLGQEGFAAGEVKLDADDALYDNTWPFCIDVRGPIRLLVISAAAERREELEDSFYLRKALDPTGDGRLSGIRVTHVTQQNAPQINLGQIDGVILCGCTALPAPTIKLLDDFLERGGGMIVFAGRQDAALGANHPLRMYLGGTIAGELKITGEQPPLGLRAAQSASPYFDDSRSLDGRVEFKEVSVFKALKVEPARDAAILAEYSDGHAALLSYARGKGRVLWWTLNPNGDDSNLPLMPDFLSLLHCSVSVLCKAQSQPLECKAGQPLSLDFSKLVPVMPGAVTLFDPDQKSFAIPVVDGRLSWRDTGRAGIYRLQAAFTGSVDGKDKGKPAFFPGGFAITPDPLESEPEYLSAEEAKRAISLKDATIIPAGTDAAPLIAASRQGRELFGIFLFAALTMVLAEAMLANMLGTRKK